jgi:hypothetical protein
MNWFQAKLAGIGAAILAVLALVVRLKVLENQRDRARVRADTLEARAHVDRVTKVVVKESKERQDAALQEAETARKEKDYEKLADLYNNPK